MPLPMVPAPTTPTERIMRAPPRGTLLLARGPLVHRARDQLDAIFASELEAADAMLGQRAHPIGERVRVLIHEDGPHAEAHEVAVEGLVVVEVDLGHDPAPTADDPGALVLVDPDLVARADRREPRRLVEAGPEATRLLGEVGRRRVRRELEGPDVTRPGDHIVARRARLALERPHVLVRHVATL